LWQLGGIAVDPWGNVFFTDSLLDNKDKNSFSYQSTVKELTFSGGSYSSSPITLYTFNDSSPGDFDDQITSVAVDTSGTIYFADEGSGIFAFPNNKGTVTTTPVYQVAAQGAKIMTTDAHGNF
jgi:hypothetical protein